MFSSKTSILLCVFEGHITVDCYLQQLMRPTRSAESGSCHRPFTKPSEPLQLKLFGEICIQMSKICMHIHKYKYVMHMYVYLFIFYAYLCIFMHKICIFNVFSWITVRYTNTEYLTVRYTNTEYLTVRYTNTVPSFFNTSWFCLVFKVGLKVYLLDWKSSNLMLSSNLTLSSNLPLLWRARTMACAC